MKESVTYLEGQIVEENVEFTLVELCRASGVSEEQLALLVAEGVVELQGANPPEWRFSGAALRRVRTAHRLARDLEINAPGVALVLDLLDEIDVCGSGPRGRPVAERSRRSGLSGQPGNLYQADRCSTGRNDSICATQSPR
jgi:chaperone modulatory protein CbpM